MSFPTQLAPRRSRRRSLAPAARHGALILASLVTLYPLVWMVSASLKPDTAIFSESARLFSHFRVENYVDGWTGTGQAFGRYVANSLIISVAAVIGNVLTCSMAGYAFARLRFRGRGVLFALMLTTLMLPHQVTLIPQYALFQSLGWVNTWLPLVVPKFFAVDAFFVFLIVQFVRGIPRELDEAARIDGCGPIRTFWRIVFPLLTPALVTTAIFTFLWTYDDFFGQLVYLSSRGRFTVPLGLRSFLDASGGSSYGQMLAMSVVALVPVVAVFLFFQKRIVEGVATTGIKG